MLKSVLASGIVSLGAISWTTAVSAHDASQVQYELRERGYYQIEFLTDEAPFQVNACRDGERYHLHVDWYGQIRERVRIGSCQEQWSRGRRYYRDDDRY